jgi:hypothetical protein
MVVRAGMLRDFGEACFFYQGSYMPGRVKFKDFLRTFKAMYQQIQGLNTEEALEISKM